MQEIADFVPRTKYIKGLPNVIILLLLLMFLNQFVSLPFSCEVLQNLAYFSAHQSLELFPKRSLILEVVVLTESSRNKL
jgi:hypothetical protein